MIALILDKLFVECSVLRSEEFAHGTGTFPLQRRQLPMTALLPCRYDMEEQQRSMISITSVEFLVSSGF